MKSIEEIKDELAERYSWGKWEYVTDDIKLKLMDEVCQEYAKQVAEAQRELDVNNARYIKIMNNISLNKESILNHPLVTDNI